MVIFIAKKGVIKGVKGDLKKKDSYLISQYYELIVK